MLGLLDFYGVQLLLEALGDLGGEVYGIDKFNYVIMILTRSILLYLVQSDITIQPHGYQECDVIFNFAAESDVDIGNQSCEAFY